MCMYYVDKFYTKIDIYCYMVFKKRKFKILNKLIGNRTIRRRHHYRPTKGKLITDKNFGNIFDLRVTNGIFSYVSWCPFDDPDCEVWLCKIPKGSLVFRNSFEYVSDNLEFISKQFQCYEKNVK